MALVPPYGIFWIGYILISSYQPEKKIARPDRLFLKAKSPYVEEENS